MIQYISVYIVYQQKLLSSKPLYLWFKIPKHLPEFISTLILYVFMYAANEGTGETALLPVRKYNKFRKNLYLPKLFFFQ